MTDRVLVAYASRTGWTVGVAEEIGKILAEDGPQVDVQPMKSVSDLSIYKGVVAGSAINGAAWLPEAMDFIRAHQDALKQRPFAAFLVCMTLAMKNGENYRSHVSSWLDPVRALVHPASEGLFAGGLDLRKVPSASDRFKFRLSVLFGVWKEGDHRDWQAIDTWAGSLKTLFA
jgi:menaquinone-dependent protoporphyrinogen oxidase